MGSAHVETRTSKHSPANKQGKRTGEVTPYRKIKGKCWNHVPSCSISVHARVRASVCNC